MSGRVANAGYTAGAAESSGNGTAVPSLLCSCSPSRHTEATLDFTAR